MFPLSHIAPFSVPFSKGSREKRVFAQKADTTYVIKNSKLYNWIFYVGREVSGSVLLPGTRGNSSRIITGLILRGY